MSDQNLEGARAPQTHGTSLTFAQLREFATDALRYWELRRIFYNLILAVIVAGHFIAAWPSSWERVTVDGVLGLFLLTVLANVAYCAVYLADVFIQVSGFRSSRTHWRRLILLVGFAFAGVLTHFFASGIFGGRD